MKTIMRRKRIVLSVLGSLLGSAAVWAHLGMSSYEPLLLGVCAGLYFLFSAAFHCTDKRALLSGVLLGLVFSDFMVLGNPEALLERRGYYLWVLIRFLGFWGMYSAALTLLFQKLSAVTLLCADVSDRSRKKVRKVFFLSFAILVFCYMLWWLNEYPGNTSPDSNSQLLQAMGLAPLSNHHPIVSTMCLKLVFDLGLKLFNGNQNAALALYTFTQLLFMAACFSYLVTALFERGVKKYAVYTVLGVFSLLPYHASYSVTVWKDVPFGGFLLVLCTVLWKLLPASGSGKKFAPADIVIFILSSLGVCLFRSNGLYCFAASLPFIIIVFGKRGAKISIAAAAVLAFSVILTGPVYSKLAIAPTEITESLSIPLQQIARVIREGGAISPEQEEMIGKLADVSTVGEVYQEHISDPVKGLIVNSGNIDYLENNKGEFFKLWLRIGLKNPGTYVRAYIDQTKGYWYPDVNYWSMSTYCMESDQLEIFKDRRMPEAISLIFSDIGYYLPKLPFGGLIFSIGLASWTLLALFTLCIVRKMYRELLIFVPILVMIATLLVATPVYAEFRYAYGLFTTLPLLGVVPFVKEQEITNG